jgi:putative hydrolase of HD superfamily
MRDELMDLLRLKSVSRQGWLNAGVPNPESVAAHSWGMAILGLRLCPPELDLARVLSLCLIHDLPEVIVGDLTPLDDRTTKSEDEHAAMLSLAPQWVALFEEYEAGSSKEAVFVHRLDKLDMALQAGLYTMETGLDLQAFVESARQLLGDDPLLG